MRQIPDYDIDLIINVRKSGGTWEQIGKIYDTAPDNPRKWASKHPRFHEIREEEKITDAVKEVIDKRTEDRRTGEITSEIKRKMREKKVLTDDELLELHALDPDSFQIRTITSNEWTVTTGEGGQYYNFQSKIVAEPIDILSKFPKQLKEIIETYTQPFDIDVMDDEKLNQTLLIPLPDIHVEPKLSTKFQVYQDSILRYLENQYKNVVIAIMGDFFNADNFNSKTANETRVADTNIPDSWEEGLLILEPIIQKAIHTSPNVTIVYSRGNHDESILWAFVKYLEVKYPQVTFESDMEQLKCVVVDDVSIFLTHGHIRRGKSIGMLCSALYPQEYGNSKYRILLTGHKHTIKSEDLIGLVHYELPTVGEGDKYEQDNLYLGNQKGIHLYEFSTDKLNAIYYL